MRDLIHLFKYQNIRPLGDTLARYLPSALPTDVSFDLVTPVPLDWRKRWSRGFNQAEVFAAHVARRRGWKLKRLLRRKFGKLHQAALSNQERRANVERVFRAAGSINGLRILLVDDVMTTGATARACALALKRAGAAHVTLLTLARVDRRLAALSAKENSRSEEQHG